MSIVLILAWILFAGFFIVSLVCWIKTLINIFKENVGLGILGLICGIFAYIYGWVKCKEYNNKKVMLVWTICVGILIISYLIIMALTFATVASQMPAMPAMPEPSF